MYHARHQELTAGGPQLSEYFPLRLSGLLELALWPQPEALHPEEALFLDTETTGLSRGTGTTPFLIGLAYFRGREICVEQIYMNGPGGEADCLAYLLERLGEFRYLVTYNGRSFDAPILRNRLTLHRKGTLPPILHFDLLHVYRRMFPRGSIASYKQPELEREMLALERTDDLPGAEIPQIYFDYVKYGHDAGMSRIFEHNERDLVGLAFLFLEALRSYAARDGARAALRSGIARILLRNRREPEALGLLRGLEAERAEESTPAPASIGDLDMAEDLRYRDLLLLGRLLARRGEIEEALEAYQLLVARYDCPFARMALAKLYEHKLRDFRAALEQCRALLVRPDDARPGPATGPYAPEELERRVNRLERKSSLTQSE